MNGTSPDSRCRTGDPAVVLTMDFPTADAAEFLATLGYAGLAVDLEHGIQHLACLPDLARSCSLGGVDLVVKTRHDDVNAIRAAVDAGATVVQLAGVQSVADLDNAVAETRFAPEGERGVGRTRTNIFGHYPGGYVRFAARPPVLLVAILESRVAISNAGAIARHPCVEVIFMGAYDLAMDCGFPGEPNAPAVRELIDQAAGEVCQAQKRLGLSASTADDLRAARARGASYLLASQARHLSQAAGRLTTAAADVPALATR